MPLKVNEFIIQAKVIEDDTDQNTSELNSDQEELSDSVKKEIIDECIIKMKELLDREKSRY